MASPAEGPSRAAPVLSRRSEHRTGVLHPLRARELPRLRYVGYRRAERDCECLAAKLLQALGRAEIEAAGFAAVPRGGLVVLGMLSYYLDLSPDQLWREPGSAEPLVVVDDCALTGSRLRRALDRFGSARLVFATLYSPAPLRAEIERREARVDRCVSAHDLEDRSAETRSTGDEPRAWRDRWRSRLGAGRYWIGNPEPVCFAWSEPSHLFWNPDTGEVEDGWRLAPPHRCLKNRARLGLPPAPGRGPRAWQAPEGLVWGEFDGVLWLCRSGDGEVVSLQGVGADMWKALAGYGNLEASVRFLGDRYEVAEETLRSDLDGFLELLRAEGLLERSGGAGREGTRR